MSSVMSLEVVDGDVVERVSAELKLIRRNKLYGLTSLKSEIDISES